MAALAELGCATVHEAAKRRGVINLDLIQVVPGTMVAGPARTVLCGQGDNLMVHAAMERTIPGDVLVICMPEPAPVGLVGELLATQALQRGAAALLVDAAVRDLEDLRALGLPIWARWVRVTGATKDVVGELDVPVTLGGVTIAPGDAVVLDADGAVVVPREHLQEVVAAGRVRQQDEERKRERYRSGELSLDLMGLRSIVDPAGPAGGETGR